MIPLRSSQSDRRGAPIVLPPWLRGPSLEMLLTFNANDWGSPTTLFNRARNSKWGNGTIISAPVWQTATGTAGRHLSMDAVDDCVDVPITFFDSRSAFTGCFLLNMKSGGPDPLGSYRIATNRDNSPPHRQGGRGYIEMHVNTATGQVDMRVETAGDTGGGCNTPGDNGTLVTLLTPAGKFALDTWVLIGYEWGLPGGMSIYVNGTREANDATKTAPTIVATNPCGNKHDSIFGFGAVEAQNYLFANLGWAGAWSEQIGAAGHDAIQRGRRY